MSQREHLFTHFLPALTTAYALVIVGCAEGVGTTDTHSTSPDDANIVVHQDLADPGTQVASNVTWSAKSMSNITVTSGEVGPVVFPPLSGTGGLFASQEDICAAVAPSAPFLTVFINLTPNVSGSLLSASTDPLKSPPLGVYALQPAAIARQQAASAQVAEGFITLSETYLGGESKMPYIRDISTFAIEGGRVTLSAIDTNAGTVDAVVEGLVTSTDQLATGGPSTYTGPSSMTLAGRSECHGFVLSMSGVGTFPF